jgi:DNA repair protein RAD7
VESLWGVPDPIRSQLASAVCARRALSPDVAQLFGSDFTSELVLPDCVQLDPAAMLQLLQLLVVGRSAAEAAADKQELQEKGLPDKKRLQDDVQQADQEQQQSCSRLERLELGNCGRGFTDEAAAALAAAGPLQQLRVLRLGGAYKLNDGGLLQLLQAAPGLQGLSVPSASRLTGGFTAGVDMRWLLICS